MVTIYSKVGAVLLQVEVDGTSYVIKRLMGDNSVVLNYSLPAHVELPVGAYCEFGGERYTLISPESLKMHHTRNYEYTVTFESAQSKAKFWKFRNPIDGRLTFSLTAKPKEHLQMLVDNLNRRDSDWEFDENSIDAVEKVISYDHSSCLEALQAIAATFETEWEIKGKTISLKKVEYNKGNPLELSYGRGNGFKPGIGRRNFSDSPSVEILLPQGGERNIDPSKYGSPTLLLPIDASLSYDGEHFEDEIGFDSALARTYITSSDGRSIERNGRSFETYAEESLDCTDIYPKRVGIVTGVELDESTGIYKIYDNTIPQELNFEECVIGGETMTVIFQSGQLAGREFEVRYKHSNRCFTIVPATIDGFEMPGSTFAPSAGGEGIEPDTYAIFNCTLPQAYFCNDSDKSGASWDMFREAVRYLYAHEDKRFSFSGELDGIWAKNDWANIGGKILLGGYVSFIDSHFQEEPALVRIIGIRQLINNPHSPTIELSNATVSGGFSTSLKQIESTEVVVEDRHREAIRYTKRRFQDTQETLKMLSDAFSADYNQPIRPATIQTVMALIGDERLQFEFVEMPMSANSIGAPAYINVVHDPATDTISVSVSLNTCLHHLTLGNHTLTSAGSASSDAKNYWEISSWLSGDLDRSKSYYLYAKCKKITEINSSLGINIGDGQFYISSETIDMNGTGADETCYYFLVAVIGSPNEQTGTRSINSVYGFTEILPGRITTDVIRSADGTNVIDLLLGRARLGNARNGLFWNENGNGKLLIKGAIQVDGGGNEGSTMLRRGVFNSSETYYSGNLVTFNGSTYICINNAENGIQSSSPADNPDWEILAETSSGGESIDALGREQTARYLGYPNWSAFENAVGANDVIIKDGYINVALLQADAIVANGIFTALAGQRLILSGSSLVVNNAQNQPMMSFSGEISHDSIDEFVSSAGSAVVKQFSISHTTPQFALHDNNVHLPFDNMVLSTTGSVTITQASTYNGFPSVGVSWVINRCQLDGYELDIRVGYVRGQEYYPAGRFRRSNISGAEYDESYSGILPPGTYTLRATVYGVAFLSTVNTPSSMTYAQCSFSGAGNVTFTPVNQGTEVFSNGLGYRYAVNEYMAAVRASAGIEWAARSGNYGLRVDPSGLKIMQNGSTWANPFIVEIAAYITVSGSGTTRTVTVTSQSSMTDNSITSGTSGGTGNYTLNFSKSVANACIIVTPRNSSTSSTNMMWISSQSGTSVTIINRTSAYSGSSASHVQGFNIIVIRTN